jgi:hypothetical protein
MAVWRRPGAQRIRPAGSGIWKINQSWLRIKRLRCQRRGTHRINGFRPEFGVEVFLLALSDAVLAGARPAHRRALSDCQNDVLAPASCRMQSFTATHERQDA